MRKTSSKVSNSNESLIKNPKKMLTAQDLAAKMKSNSK